MTEEKARSKAEEIVYVYYTMPTIVFACEKRGIKTETKSGKLRKRSDLEAALIDAMTKEFMEKQ